MRVRLLSVFRINWHLLRSLSIHLDATDSGMSAEDFPRNRLVEAVIENMANSSVAPTIKFDY